MQSSREGLDFKSRRRGSRRSGKGRRCLECCQGSIETIGLEEVEIPRLLVTCICKCVADSICVVQGYTKKFGSLLEVFLGLDQVPYVFEHLLIVWA